MKLKRLMVPAWLSLMIVLLACPPVQAYSGMFYVIPTSAPLRECASPECAVLLTVYQGAKVEILERTPTGWSKVRVVDQAAMGWIPSDWLSISPDRQTVGLPTYYVNTNSLPLRVHPRSEAQILTTLHFNDPVEMLGVGKSGWAQVRDLKTSQVGWAPPRYLSETSLSSPPSSPRRRAPARKAPPKEEPAPAKPKAM
jgi:uncharacterized protein YgiM (DUF1202 family)